MAPLVKGRLEDYLFIMPLARTHLRIELIIFGCCILVACFLRRKDGIGPTEAKLFLSSYLFSSLFLSPDLDLARSRASRRWGIGRVLWWPYSHFFRHRRLSHHLMWGPLTRILYFGGILFTLAWGMTALMGRSFSWPALPWSVLGAILCGFYLPNQIHILVDWIWSMRR
jgi:uncharacterized metal-binding protein